MCESSDGRSEGSSFATDDGVLVEQVRVDDRHRRGAGWHREQCVAGAERANGGSGCGTEQGGTEALAPDERGARSRLPEQEFRVLTQQEGIEPRVLKASCMRAPDGRATLEKNHAPPSTQRLAVFRPQLAHAPERHQRPLRRAHVPSRRRTERRERGSRRWLPKCIVASARISSLQPRDMRGHQERDDHIEHPRLRVLPLGHHAHGSSRPLASWSRCRSSSNSSSLGCRRSTWGGSRGGGRLVQVGTGACGVGVCRRSKCRERGAGERRDGDRSVRTEGSGFAVVQKRSESCALRRKSHGRGGPGRDGEGGGRRSPTSATQ